MRKALSSPCVTPPSGRLEKSFPILQIEQNLEKTTHQSSLEGPSDVFGKRQQPIPDTLVAGDLVITAEMPTVELDIDLEVFPKTFHIVGPRAEIGPEERL